METPKNSLKRNRGSTYELPKNEEVVMLSLYQKELYGLQIPKAIEEVSQGRRKVGIGSLYPTLHNLEKKGFVESRWGDERPEERSGARRRYYRLSGDGVATIEAIQQFRNDLLAWQPS